MTTVENQQQEATTPPAAPPLPTGGQRLATNSKGEPAHAYEVDRAAGPNGFLWWVVALRYPVERRDDKAKTLTLSGKPQRWRVAGPFATKAIAEGCIAPSARR